MTIFGCIMLQNFEGSVAELNKSRWRPEGDAAIHLINYSDPDNSLGAVGILQHLMKLVGSSNMLKPLPKFPKPHTHENPLTHW